MKLNSNKSHLELNFLIVLLSNKKKTSCVSNWFFKEPLSIDILACSFKSQCFLFNLTKGYGQKTVYRQVKKSGNTKYHKGVIGLGINTLGITHDVHNGDCAC